MVFAMGSSELNQKRNDLSKCVAHVIAQFLVAILISNQALAFTTMPKGQFNDAQEKILVGYFPEYIQKLDAGLRGLELTKWKQAVASKVLELPEFLDLDCAKNPRPKWFAIIVRKYTNYYHQVYKKDHPEEPSALTIAKENPLLKFSSILSGRQMFARDTHDTILAASRHYNERSEFEELRDDVQARARARRAVLCACQHRHRFRKLSALASTHQNKSRPSDRIMRYNWRTHYVAASGEACILKFRSSWMRIEKTGVATAVQVLWSNHGGVLNCGKAAPGQQLYANCALVGLKKAMNEVPEGRNRNGDTQMGLLNKQTQPLKSPSTFAVSNEKKGALEFERDGTCYISTRNVWVLKINTARFLIAQLKVLVFNYAYNVATTRKVKSLQVKSA
ncbi:hypothetical protein C8J57DRAFT_1245181 [Mycena rebaudengoi]|nr:hypothetical protein C8J57DRAFT_1245181 [Mycena rebaudengoi]